jgi:hypothetical protein
MPNALQICRWQFEIALFGQRDAGSAISGRIRHQSPGSVQTRGGGVRGISHPAKAPGRSAAVSAGTFAIAVRPAPGYSFSCNRLGDFVIFARRKPE